MAFSKKIDRIDITNTRGLQKDITLYVVCKTNKIRVKNHTIVVVTIKLPNGQEVMMQLWDVKGTIKTQWLGRSRHSTLINRLSEYLTIIRSHMGGSSKI